MLLGTKEYQVKIKLSDVMYFHVVDSELIVAFIWVTGFTSSRVETVN